MGRTFTPRDITGYELRRAAFHGYDPDDVTAFKKEVAGFVQVLIEDRDASALNMQQMKTDLEESKVALQAKEGELHLVQQKLAEYTGIDQELRSALIGAQKSAKDTVDQAASQAEQILAEARAEVERILKDAEDIRMRARVEAELLVKDAKEVAETITSSANKDAESIVAKAQHQRETLELEAADSVKRAQGELEDIRMQRDMVTSECNTLEAKRDSLHESIQGVFEKLHENQSAILGLLNQGA